jgi:hypothetical protein
VIFLAFALQFAGALDYLQYVIFGVVGGCFAGLCYHYLSLSKEEKKSEPSQQQKPELLNNEEKADWWKRGDPPPY